MTEIDVTAQVPVATASLADPEAFLPPPARPAGPGRWVVDFSVGPFHHEALVTLGPMWRSAGRSGRAIQWSPTVDDHDALPYRSLMPSVAGELLLEDGTVGLHVHYTPAIGVLGRLVDPLLRPFARQSVTRFLHEVTRALQGQVPTPAGDR